ncbi:MAG: arsenic resistance N-acetyltransferase ArsN2 [Steroidobacteraceae bacterium]
MPAVLELLQAARLPTQDLARAKRLQLWVMEAEGRLLGVIGLECFGTNALLRSLAVASQHRRHGVARELVSRLEEEARSTGIERLVLLTETAEAFFCRLGYEPIGRRDVPGEIKQSAEFHSLCPASAVCLTKLLNA